MFLTACNLMQMIASFQKKRLKTFLFNLAVLQSFDLNANRLYYELTEYQGIYTGVLFSAFIAKH